jgi:hypothetical protein
MHTARSSATATLLPNGKVLIVGGMSALPLTQDFYASAELYDPATGKFTKTGSMTAARAQHTATLLADGRVLIAGGNGCPDPRQCSGVFIGDVKALASAELYDPKTGKFSPTGSMATARWGATATLLPDGRVLVAQGILGGLPSAELYDPKSGVFARAGKEIIGSGAAASASLLPSGKVLLTASVVGIPPVGALYDEASGKFKKISFALAPGASPSAQGKGQTVELGYGPAIVLKDGRVLLFEGGHLETYEPATGACADAGFISPDGLWLEVTATLLNDGRVLFLGGALFPSDSTSVAAASAVLYDPAGGPQTIGSMRSARANQTATLLPNGTVLIAGGQDANGKPLASAELFKP